jgi:hypothetical protein
MAKNLSPQLPVERDARPRLTLAVTQNRPFQTLDFCLVHAGIVDDMPALVTTVTGEDLPITEYARSHPEFEPTASVYREIEESAYSLVALNKSPWEDRTKPENRPYWEGEILPVFIPPDQWA